MSSVGASVSENVIAILICLQDIVGGGGCLDLNASFRGNIEYI